MEFLAIAAFAFLATLGLLSKNPTSVTIGLVWYHTQPSTACTAG